MYNLLNLLLLSITLETIEKKCLNAILCKALSHSIVKGYYLGTLLIFVSGLTLPAVNRCGKLKLNFPSSLSFKTCRFAY